MNFCYDLDKMKVFVENLPEKEIRTFMFILAIFSLGAKELLSIFKITKGKEEKNLIWRFRLWS